MYADTALAASSQPSGLSQALNLGGALILLASDPLATRRPRQPLTEPGAPAPGVRLGRTSLRPHESTLAQECPEGIYGLPGRWRPM